MSFDPFLLLTPILLLAVLGLVRFVGCQLLLDFERPEAPESSTQTAGAQITSVVLLGTALACKTARLRVTGANFVNGAAVLWNGAALPTSFVSATQLEAEVAVNDAAATSAQVTVVPPSGTPPPPFTFNFTVERGAPKTVTFETLRPNDGTRDGPVPNVFAGIEFGNGWNWFDHTTGPEQVDILFRFGQEASFSFANGERRIVESIVVLNFSSNTRTVSLSDDAQQPKAVDLPGSTSTNATHSVPTGWTKCSRTVKVQCVGPGTLYVRAITHLDPS